MKGGVCVSQRIHTSIRLQQGYGQKNMKQVDLLNAVKPLCDKYKPKNYLKDGLSQYLSEETNQAINAHSYWLKR